MKKALIIFLSVLIVIPLLFTVYALYNIRDRSPDYGLEVMLPEPEEQNGTALKVGLAKVPITPDIPDTWVDADSNARFEPDKGDSYTDKNGNGRFDAYWLAGFQQNRPAQGVHDDIWARAIVWDNGRLCVALVVLDAIGIFHDDVIDIRSMIAEQTDHIDHIIVTSTHNHEVPDLMGLWGPGILKSGVNNDYLQFVKEQAGQAVTSAYHNRKPAIVRLAKIDSTDADLVSDSRPPFVLDNSIHLMQFVDAENRQLLGMLMNWGNHPETLANRNLQVTADFAHYWIAGIEQGIQYDGEIKQAGIGGIAVFANGAVGGLMTSLGSEIHDPWLQQSFKESCFDKARAQGYRLAKLVLDHQTDGQWQTVENPPMFLYAKTFLFDLDNSIFKIGGALGILNRGFVDWQYLRSEVNVFVIGPAWMLTIPGEINPEIVNGGIENPQGADFPGSPVEDPPLRALMPGKFNFILGLANDEVGYIMPKTHWDTKKPYTYEYSKPPYAEINSLGPETGPTMYREAKTAIMKMAATVQ
jgi:hypothetical protein